MHLADGVGHCVLEGDLPRGVSTLIDCSVTADNREQVSPVTLFDNYVADAEVDGKHVELELWDMGASNDRIRPLGYPDSHAILICFSISNPDTLDNVQEEVRRKLLNTSVLIFYFSLIAVY